MAEEHKEAQSDEVLNLKVSTQDGNEVYFKCKKTTQLSKLMNAFCDRQGMPRDAVRFLFDGERINPDHTPAQLGMEDGDAIDAMVEQQGGRYRRGLRALAPPEPRTVSSCGTGQSCRGA